jgi:hypothetical protein
MGILSKVGKAIVRGLEKIESEAANAERLESGGDVPLAAPVDDGALKELAFYKRRSQEYFALIRKMEAQREEWKSLYQRDSQGHQSAQAVLQEHIVTLRTQVVGLISMINAHRKEKNEPPFDLSKLVLDLHAFPVGIAQATAERNAHDLASVAPQTDATEALRAIHAEVPAPPGIVPAEDEPPKNS